SSASRPAATSRPSSCPCPPRWPGHHFMPTVLRTGPYRLFFFSDEGTELPHVHVARDDLLAKFWLRPVRIASNHGFPPRELRRIHRIVTQHEDDCWSAWHDHFA